MKFYRQGRAEGDFRRGHRNGPERRAGESPVPVPRRAGSAGPRPRRPPIGSATSISRRACRSSCGAASRTTSCSTWPRATNSASPRCSRNRCGGCWRTVARSNLATNFAVQWLHLRNLDVDHAGPAPVPGLRRQSAEGLPARRRSCSSRACCARTGACSTC